MQPDNSAETQVPQSLLSIGLNARAGPGDSHAGAAALLRMATKVRCIRNRTIFNDVDGSTFAYRIVSGTVRLCKHTVQGRRLVTHFLMLGDYFGFMQLGPYSFTAEAVTAIPNVRSKPWPSRIRASGSNSTH